jgi:Zincin-like metallopeptidase
VVPSVAEIRERFNTRRKTAGRVEQAIRRLLGIDLKMRQYADGARFVRAVVDQIGMDGFNKVWESPATIPTMSEISDPNAWIARVASGFTVAPAVTAPPSAPPVTAPVNGTSPASSVGPVSEPEPPTGADAAGDPAEDTPAAGETAGPAVAEPTARGEAERAAEADGAAEPAGEASRPWFDADHADSAQPETAGQAGEPAPEGEEGRLWRDGQ